MSRVIKFRAWGPNSKKMWDWAETQELIKEFGWEGEKIIMQFTGLHDKNGKEIYEGDIVRVQYLRDSAIGPVSYLEDETCFVWWPVPKPEFGKQYRELGHGAYGVEVIGNIYENPDLCSN